MGEHGWSIAIHGGAGTMNRATMSAAQQAEYEAALGAALDAGAKVLAEGGSALDAVEAAVVVLEDDPHFNAGRGAVFTYNGTNEQFGMDRLDKVLENCAIGASDLLRSVLEELDAFTEGRPAHDDRTLLVLKVS